MGDLLRDGPRRVAIVHDNLLQFGGAERVLLEVMSLYPHAPVFTLLYNPEVSEAMRAANAAFDESRIRTSFLQKIPGAKTHYHYLPTLMPTAIEQFDLRHFDLVISTTYSFAKGLITDPETVHVSYCFTPTRYVWDDCHRYFRDFVRVGKLFKLAPLGLSRIRLWDYYASQRVDQYLTSSHFVAQRIQKYYRRVAEVITPPVHADQFQVSSTAEYYLVVARLVPYKKTELAIEACQRLGKKLIVAGTGPELKRLKSMASSTTQFVGFVNEADIPDLYAGAKALLFPQEEDFGITPLEAAAAGKPTIAFASGGAQETIIDGLTGVLFPKQTVASLMEAIKYSEATYFDPQIIRSHAEKFTPGRFADQFSQAVQRVWISSTEPQSNRSWTV